MRQNTRGGYIRWPLRVVRRESRYCVDMKRRTLLSFAALTLLAVLGVSTVAANVPDAAAHASDQLAATQQLASPAVRPASGVDDFSFASLNAEYVLGRNDEGNSTLRVTEAFVALFPETDQNRGIRRALPMRYDGHPTDLTIQSVTDENGTPRAFTAEADDDGEFMVVTIAARDYVHGNQSYVLKYSERNVTLDPSDSDLQELYRDVNGVGWAQPFDVVTATLTLDPELDGSFAGQAACYQGWDGSSQACDELEVSASPPFTLTARANNLDRYQNLTFALAFEPATFVPRDSSLRASPVGMVGFAAGLAALGVLCTAVVTRVRRWRNAPGRGIVIAEYEPARDMDPLLASELWGKRTKGVSAAILDMAVTGAVAIVETKKKRFSVELRERLAARPEERAVLDALFGPGAKPGARLPLASTNNAVSSRLAALSAATKKRATTSGFRRAVDVGRRRFFTIAVCVLAALAWLFSMAAASADFGGGWTFGIVVVATVSAVATLVLVSDVRPFTREGAIALEQLKGLELYIRLAEADRLRVLQSPSGALRDEYASAQTAQGSLTTPLSAAYAQPGTSSTEQIPLEQIVRLHEKLLPYSVVFGLEKEWSAELASLYARTEEPGWFEGTSGFTPAAFAMGVSSFTSASSSSWSGSSSSSSSSGSSGGGSSGGGGGGGGGGGV